MGLHGLADEGEERGPHGEEASARDSAEGGLDESEARPLLAQ